MLALLDLAHRHSVCSEIPFTSDPMFGPRLALSCCRLCCSCSTNLNEHQSNANLASLNSLSTLVRLKSRGQERNFHKGFTSSCSSFNSWENGVELPSLMTTPSPSLGFRGKRAPSSTADAKYIEKLVSSVPIKHVLHV